MPLSSNQSKLNDKTSTFHMPFFTGEQQREDKTGYIYLLMETDVEFWRNFQQEIALLLIRTRDSEPCGAPLRSKYLGAQPACLHQTNIGYRRLGKGRNLARMAARILVSDSFETLTMLPVNQFLLLNITRSFFKPHTKAHGRLRE